MSGRPVVLDDLEHYQKQSWRNRLRYLAADGVHDFSIPVIHPHGSAGDIQAFNPVSDSSPVRPSGAHTTPITEIRVDYSTPWVRNLRRTLTTAYSSAAYFDYYAPEFFAVLESRPDRLWDLNLSMLGYLRRALLPSPDGPAETPKEDFLKLSELQKDFPVESPEGHLLPASVIPDLTDLREQDTDSPCPTDLREAFHPKRPLPFGIEPIAPYFQVFSDRLGYTPGLSAIDLLFNEGPEASSLLSA